MFRLWKLYQILNISEKKIIAMANVFPKLKTLKTWLDHSLTSAVPEHPLAVTMLMGPKHLWNLRESTFIIFFGHSEKKWFAK